MPQGRYLFSLLICHEIVLQSERGSSHYPLEGNGHLERKNSKKNNALHGMVRRERVMRFDLLIRDLQLHTAVNDIAFKSVQTDNLLAAVTVTEILLCDCP